MHDSADTTIDATTGITVLITRPRYQAEPTAALLTRHGVKPIVFPTLQVNALDVGSVEAIELKKTLHDLPQTECLIFVSANAVTFGWPWILRETTLPKSAQVMAIGHATALALRTLGVENVLIPDAGNDSEALLSHPIFAIDGTGKGMRIIIFRGKSEAGGRTFLGDNLRERGALVSMAECYVRKTATVNADVVNALWHKLQAHEIDAVNVQSVETFDALVTILSVSGRTKAEVIQALQDCVMLVPHPRVGAALQAAGLMNIKISGMGDEALSHTLKELNQDHGKQHH